MDPNMMNQNYQMGGVEPQMMNYQEQTQAQVLNYNDVEMTAEKENKAKSTKKIALFFAALGIILIAGGVFYTLNPSDEQTAAPASESKNIEETTAPVEDSTQQPAANTTTCTLTDNSGTDGTTRQTVYTIVFDDNLALTSYSKKYSVATIQGAQSATGSAKVKEESNTLTSLSTAVEQAGLTGYTIQLTPTQEGDVMTSLVATINIDFATLDVTKLPVNISRIASTKVDLRKGQTQEEVKKQLTSYGCTCQ